MDDPKKQDEQENQVILEDVPEVIEKTKPSKEDLENEGLSSEEIKMAESHGLIEEKKEDGEHKSKPKVSTEGAPKVEEGQEGQEEVNKDPDSFEELDKVFEKDEKKFHKVYTSNQKALYFKYKNEREKRQRYTQQLEDAKKESDFYKVKQKGLESATNKLDKISALLGKEDLTVEDIEAVIKNKNVESTESVVTAKDLEDVKQQEQDKIKKDQEHQQQVNERLVNLKKTGLAIHEDFENIVKLADEVTKSDAFYGEKINNDILNQDVSEADIVNTIVKVAKLNEKYGQSIETEKKPTNSNVDRMVKNANKHPSSAAVTSTSGRRVITHNDLTPEDAARMSSDQWSKLPDNVRQKLLQS